MIGFGTILLLLGVALLIPTAYAGLIGAPYAPTWIAVVKKAFAEIKLSQKDTLIDLGAGDGKILIEAAKRGATALGFELSPIMFTIAWIRASFTHRVWRKPVVKFKNFYHADLSSATVLFTFLMPKNMPRLKTFLSQQHIPGAKYLLVYSFPLPDTDPIKVVKAPQAGSIYIYDLKNLTQA